MGKNLAAITSLVLLFCLTLGANATSFLDDTLADTNGTAITAHVPTHLGEGWIGDATFGNTGLSSINSNRLNSTNATFDSNFINLAVPPSANYSVSATLFSPDGNGANPTGVKIRSSYGTVGVGTANYYLADIGNGNNAEIWKNIGNTLTNLFSVAISGGVVAGETYTLTLTGNGTTITGKLQRASDSNYLSTSGAWQSAVTNYKSLTDNSVTAMGFAGVWVAASSTSGIQVSNVIMDAVQTVPSPNKFVYPHFFQSAGTQVESLVITQTADIQTYQIAPSRYLQPAGHCVRDPSMEYDTFSTPSFWIAHTSACNATPTSKSFDIASATKDGSGNLIFTYVASVDCSAITGPTAGACWCPRFVHNPDGSTWLDASNIPHIIVAATATESTDNGFQFYETHPTNAARTTWSALVLVTGTSFPANVIDGQAINTGGTTNFNLYLKNETTKNVSIWATTTGLTSGYISSIPNILTNVEGPVPVQYTGGNNWTITVDDLSAGFTKYSLSTNNQVTWSSLTAVTSPVNLINGAGILWPATITSVGSLLLQGVGN